MKKDNLYFKLKKLAKENGIAIFEKPIENINENESDKNIWACGLYIFLPDRSAKEQNSLTRKALRLDKELKLVEDESSLFLPRILIDNGKDEANKGKILLHELGHHFAILECNDYSDEKANEMKDYILKLAE